jgi:hypothetical protein
MKTKLFPIIYVIIILFLVEYCKKEEPLNLSDESLLCTGQVPIVTVQSATNIAGSRSELHGTVFANCLLTTVSFEYGTTAIYGSTISASQSPVAGDSISNVSADISSLMPNTTYHFRIKAGNSKGTVYSGDKTFTTFKCGQGLAVTTLPATNISQKTMNIQGSDVTLTTLTLNAAVFGNGLPTTVTFYFGDQPDTRPGTKIAAVRCPATGYITKVSSDISFTSGIGRYFRVEAINACGTAYSNPIKLTVPK